MLALPHEVAELAADPGHRIATADLTASLRRALRMLPPRQQLIIEQHYGLRCTAKTLTEIGHKWGITASRVSDLHIQALCRLSRGAPARALMDAYTPSGWQQPPPAPEPCEQHQVDVDLLNECNDLDAWGGRCVHCRAWVLVASFLVERARATRGYSTRAPR